MSSAAENLPGVMPKRRLWKCLKSKTQTGIGTLPRARVRTKEFDGIRRNKIRMFVSAFAGGFYLAAIRFQRFQCCSTQLHCF